MLEALWTDLAEKVSKDSPILTDVAAALAHVGTIDGFFVRPETVFDRDSVFDAVAVFVVTERHMIIVMSDVTYELGPAGDFVTTTQVVELAQIRDFQIVRRRVLEGPEAGAVSAVQLRLRWGSGWGADIRPASCDDPNCDADHGYVAMGQGEDAEIVLDSSVDAHTFDQGIKFVDLVVSRLVRG